MRKLEVLLQHSLAVMLSEKLNFLVSLILVSFHIFQQCFEYQT